jgi:hypothetical protein
VADNGSASKLSSNLGKDLYTHEPNLAAYFVVLLAAYFVVLKDTPDLILLREKRIRDPLEVSEDLA